MHYEEADPEKLAASTRRAREARHKGRPVRAHREAHPTAVRNLLLIVAFVALGVFTALRILQYAH
jgi:hypothetical protein